MELHHSQQDDRHVPKKKVLELVKVISILYTHYGGLWFLALRMWSLLDKINVFIFYFCIYIYIYIYIYKVKMWWWATIPTTAPLLFCSFFVAIAAWLGTSFGAYHSLQLHLAASSSSSSINRHVEEGRKAEDPREESPKVEEEKIVRERETKAVGEKCHFSLIFQVLSQV